MLFYCNKLVILDSPNDLIHPQDLVNSFFKLDAVIYAIFPQSHWHFHTTEPFFLSGVISNTVNLPNFLLVKSSGFLPPFFVLFIVFLPVWEVVSFLKQPQDLV